MKCISEELLWEYLDNEVSQGEKHKIETHLGNCPRCKGELEQLQFFNQAFKKAVINQTPSRKSIEKFIEIKLNDSETRLRLQGFWRKFVMFGFFVSLVTAFFVALAFPVNGTNFFETEFQVITYALSQLIDFMGRPIVMDIWMITITFSFLFWADKVWRSGSFKI